MTADRFSAGLCAHCDKPRARNTFSPFCAKHRRHAVRHGDPLQVGIRSSEVAPWRTEVRRLLDTHDTGGKVRNALSVLTRNLKSHCDLAITTAATGRTYVRPQYEAQRTLASALDSAGTGVGIEVAALFLLSDRDKRRFRSDRAFLHQLARMVQRLASRQREVYPRPGTHQRRMVYREMRPKEAEWIASMAHEGFAKFAAWVVQTARREEADASALAFAFTTLNEENDR